MDGTVRGGEGLTNGMFWKKCVRLMPIEKRISLMLCCTFLHNGESSVN